MSKQAAAVLEPDNEIRQYTTKKIPDASYGEPVFITDGLKNWCKSVFYESEALIFIGACGIAVRTIAPFLKTKVKDPAVLVMDEQGKNVISLLSGHLGGGNELTEYLAKKLGANPVITTASDVQGRLAIDVWAKKNGLVIADMKLAKQAAADIVAGKRLPFYCEGAIVGEIPKEFDYVQDVREDSQGKTAVVVSIYNKWAPNVLHLIPRVVVLGIGCKQGKSFGEISAQVNRVLDECHIPSESICKIASIDRKAKEAGICALAKEWRVPFVTFSAEELQSVSGTFKASEFVKSITGADNVCERSAMAAFSQKEQEKAEFISRKRAADGVTVALACREWSVSFE